jgi:Mg-chelatase subunit ChlD
MACVLPGVLAGAVTLAGAVAAPRIVAAQIVAAQIVSQAEVQTGIFGLEARGSRFVYVFDRSASMAEPDGRPLARAKEELLRSLEQLGDVQQFSIIFYNERMQLFTPGAARRPIFATADTKRAARRFVDSVRAAGGTRHAEPLAAALRLAPDVIFMLTDGDEADDLTAEEHAKLAESLGRTRCMIVQFGGDDAVRSPRLARLATQSGGSYTVVDAAE